MTTSNTCIALCLCANFTGAGICLASVFQAISAPSIWIGAAISAAAFTTHLAIGGPAWKA